MVVAGSTIHVPAGIHSRLRVSVCMIRTSTSQTFVVRSHLPCVLLPSLACARLSCVNFLKNSSSPLLLCSFSSLQRVLPSVDPGYVRAYLVNAPEFVADQLMYVNQSSSQSHRDFPCVAIAGPIALAALRHTSPWTASPRTTAPRLGWTRWFSPRIPRTSLWASQSFVVRLYVSSGA